MKKHFIIACACLFALCLGLTACGGSGSSSNASTSGTSTSASSGSAASSSSAASSTSSAAASTSSSSAASASASTGEISYETTDHFFREAYEEDGKVYFDTVLEVANTGDTTIVFDGVVLAVVDENKESIAAPSGIYLSPGYILPGKTAFVYPANPIRLPDGASASADYRTGFDLAFAKTDKKVTEYPVTEMPPYESNGRPAIGGKVTNNTNVASGEITVVVSYYDNDDQLLGVAEDTIANLNPGESVNFRMLDSDVQRHCSWALVSSHKVQATSLN